MPVRPLPAADLAHILQHTETLWPELAGKRLFITGGTGFFGLWLLETLAYAKQRLSLDLTATILTRDAKAFARNAPHLAHHPMFDWVEGDMRGVAFPPGEFSHLLHAATPSSIPPPPQELLDTIIDGTRHVLDFARAARVQRLLFLSSGAVYGPQPPELTHISETAPCAPNPVLPTSAYGEGKRIAELLCALTAQETGMVAVIARCFAFIGPHLPLDVHFAAGNFLRDALCGGPIRIESDGRPVRSYLHMTDLMIWLLTLLVRGKSAYPYNVGSGEAVSLLELAEHIQTAFLLTTPIVVRSPASNAPAPRYVPDVGLAKRELGLDVHIPLTEAIARTAAWLQCA